MQAPRSAQVRSRGHVKDLELQGVGQGWALDLAGFKMSIELF